MKAPSITYFSRPANKGPGAVAVRALETPEHNESKIEAEINQMTPTADRRHN